MGNALCDGFIDNLLSHTAYLSEFPNDSEVTALTNAIFTQIAKEEVGSPFQTIGLFLQLLGKIQKKRLFDSHLPPSSLHDEKKIVKLKAVLKYIREHFADNVTLEDMSAVAGFSNKYFCKFFKDMTGTTPVNYLLTYRIVRAARKLLGTDLSVTQIAYDCGFNDLSYFIKTFKAFKHTSPKEYRKK
jgi:AraC-like DNA-binding protein